MKLLAGVCGALSVTVWRAHRNEVEIICNLLKAITMPMNYISKSWLGSCGCCLLVLQLVFSLSHEIPFFFSRPSFPTTALFYQYNFYVYSFFRKTFLQIVLAWSGGAVREEVPRRLIGMQLDVRLIGIMAWPRVMWANLSALIAFIKYFTAKCVKLTLCSGQDLSLCRKIA